MMTDTMSEAAVSLVLVTICVICAVIFVLIIGHITQGWAMLFVSLLAGMILYAVSLAVPAYRDEQGHRVYRPLPYHSIALSCLLLLVLVAHAINDIVVRALVFGGLLLVLSIGGIALLYLWQNISRIIDKDQNAIPDILEEITQPQETIRLIPANRQVDEDDFIVAGPHGGESARDIIAFLREVDRRIKAGLPYGQRAMRHFNMPSGRYPLGMGDALYNRITAILEQAKIWERGDPGRLLVPVDEAIAAIKKSD